MSGVFSSEDHKVSAVVAEKVADAIEPFVKPIHIQPVPFSGRKFVYVIVGDETFIVSTQDLESAWQI